MNNNIITLFNTVCLFKKQTNNTILYGQCLHKVVSCEIPNSKKNVDVVFCKEKVFCQITRKKRPSIDFFIKIKGKISHIDIIKFTLKCGNNNKNKFIECRDLALKFPLETHELEINKNSAIIVTMCKDYGHRLDEWIQYNLKLGFSGIVIFDNDKNTSNTLNEPTENCIKSSSIQEVCKKYKEKVLCIEFDYSPLGINHWNTIQRTIFNISINGLKSLCNHIALIDPDEFIFIPEDPENNIERFLLNYKSIRIKSNLLTNKNNDDIINNNILNIAKYIGEDKYTKVILHTSTLKENAFYFTPHKLEGVDEILEKEKIIHYHCWLNNRYHYTPTMKKIEFLEDFYKNKF